MQRGKRSPILRRFRITTRLGGAIPTWSSRSSSRGSWGFRSLLPSPPSTPRVPADTEPRPPGFQRCSRAAAAEKPAAGQRSARVRGGRCAGPGEEPGLRGPSAHSGLLWQNLIGHMCGFISGLPILFPWSVWNIACQCRTVVISVALWHILKSGCVWPLALILFSRLLWLFCFFLLLLLSCIN